MDNMDNSIDYKNLYRSHDIKVAVFIMAGFLLLFLLVYGYCSMDAVSMDLALQEGRYDAAIALYNEEIVDRSFQRGVASVFLRSAIRSICADYEKGVMPYAEAVEALLYISQAEDAGVSERALAALETMG